MCGRSRVPVVLDAKAHLSKATGAVLLAEGVPGETGWQAGPMGKETAAYDEVVRAVELEEQRLRHFETPEPATRARLPKIHFVRWVQFEEELEPLLIGDRDERLH